MSQDVRIRDYFSKPKGVCEQINLGNADTGDMIAHICSDAVCCFLTGSVNVKH